MNVYLNRSPLLVFLWNLPKSSAHYKVHSYYNILHHSIFSSSSFLSSPSIFPWFVNVDSAAGGALVSPLSPSQRTVEVFWLDCSRKRGGVLWSPGLKDWETPEPALARPMPHPWRDPSLRRPPEPERMAGLPGAEMSTSVWDGAFLNGDGDTGALRGSETVWNEIYREKV